MKKLLLPVLASLMFALTSCGPATGVPAGDSGWAKGNIDSKIVLMEFSDLQCPACKAAMPAVKQVMSEFGGDIRFEYHHFPLSIHKNAQIAAQAAEAAGKQGNFWEMHDMLFDNQATWAEMSDPKETFKEYAKNLGINVVKFEKDMMSDEVKQRIARDVAMAEQLKLDRTPSFVLNGMILRPASFDELRSLIKTGIESGKKMTGSGSMVK